MDYFHPNTRCFNNFTINKAEIRQITCLDFFTGGLIKIFISNGNVFE